MNQVKGTIEAQGKDLQWTSLLTPSPKSEVKVVLGRVFIFVWFSCFSQSKVVSKTTKKTLFITTVHILNQ